VKTVVKTTHLLGMPEAPAPEPLTRSERADLWRWALPASLLFVALTVSPSKMIAEPYATLAWLAWGIGMASTFLSERLLVRYGRRKPLRQRDGNATVIIPGRRVRDAIGGIGMLIMAPQMILWAIEGEPSMPLPLAIFMTGLLWLATACIALAAIVGVRRLLRPDNAIRADASGIGCPELWHPTIPWARITDIRTNGTRDDTKLVIAFDAPLDINLVPRRFGWRAKLDPARLSLTIPDGLLGIPAEDVAAQLHDHVRRSEEATV